MFIGHEIQKLLRDDYFIELLNREEVEDWKAFKFVAESLLRNQRAENYVQQVENMVTVFRNLGRQRSLKLHFLHSHLDFFRSNLDAVSDQHRKRFHKDTAHAETRYKAKRNVGIIGKHCCCLLQVARPIKWAKNISSSRNGSIGSEELLQSCVLLWQDLYICTYYTMKQK